jgi:hypothetical protein
LASSGDAQAEVEVIPHGIAWAAGYFEGRYSAFEVEGRRRLSIHTSDEVCVGRFQQIAGGKVYGPYDNASMERRDGFKRAPSFMWIAEMAEADAVVLRLRPYLTEATVNRIETMFAKSL